MNAMSAVGTVMSSNPFYFVNAHCVTSGFLVQRMCIDKVNWITAHCTTVASQNC